MTRRFSWSLPLMTGGIFGAISTLATVGDPDLFWHLAQGRQTVTEGLARVDAFSWSVKGLPVLTDQWFGQVIWYEAYAALGWNGIIVLRALLVAAIVTLIVAAALRAQRRPIFALIATLPAIALTRFAWTERPQLMGLLCFAVLVLLLQASAERPRLLMAVPALIVVWANLHASFALGLGVTAIACAELWLRRPDARRLVVGVIAASIAATLLTPSGLTIWTSASGHFLSPPRIILEEGVPDVTQPYGFVFAFIVLAVLVTAQLSRPTVLREVALLVPVLFVSMTAARHTPFFAVASASYLAAHAPDAIAFVAARFRINAHFPAFAPRVPPLRIDVAMAAIALAAVVGTGLLARGEPDLSAYPTGVLSSLPPGPGVVNDYDWGGFLIWYAPATPVFIDGRLFPYTGDALRDYETLVSLGPTWRDVLARRGARAVLVKPGSPLAVRARDLRWSVVAESVSYVLFIVPNSR
ncbi:MAG TPA: hypothetical protein VNE19_01115 [Methylomirabilota bacterium]|nr:hypothetical protein [Methylomirabilota bacterium]